MPEPGMIRCGYCGEYYSMGKPTGTLFIFYPEGEKMYWKHVGQSVRHQTLLDMNAISTHQMMQEFGVILKEFKKYQAKIKRQEKKREATSQG